MNPILSHQQTLRSLITKLGRPHNNTLELIDEHVIISLTRQNGRLPNIDLWAEEIANQDREKWFKKLDDELFHYEQLKYSLLHKVKEVRYFFGSDIENRKLIVFSNDCISSAQYIKRGGNTYLLVYMRSSDIDALFPMDALYLCKILREINEYYVGIDNVESETVSITIGSAHIYTSGGRDE